MSESNPVKHWYVYSLLEDGWHRAASVLTEQMANEMAEAIQKANPGITVEVVEGDTEETA